MGATALSWLVPVFSQMGFGVAVVLVTTGFVFTVSTAVAVGLVHPLAVAVKLYVPAFVGAAVAFTMAFWLVLVKAFGPVHTKVVPMSVRPNTLNWFPMHTPAGLSCTVAVGVGFFVKVKGTVVAVPNPAQVTSATSSQVPDGMLAVLCSRLVPNRLAVGLPTGP